VERPIAVIRVVTFMLALLAIAGCSGPAATGTTTPQSPAAGMAVTDSRAIPMPGFERDAIVTARITNRTGRDDKLMGGSSPVATAVGLYATCSCMPPEPTDPVTGIPGLVQMPWLLIKAGETTQLIAGDGEMVLSGLSEPLVVGQTVEVTFKFASADPVTLQVPVVSVPGAEATAETFVGTAAAPTMTPAASYFSSGTPRPGDEAMAVSIATQYQTFLQQGDWAKAWAMLSPEDKAGEPYDVFVYNWAAIKASWHTLDFTLGTPTHDWQNWDQATSIAARSISGDFGRAFVIQVTYPFTGQTNFWDVLLIMPTIDGASWTVSEVR
jgi:copper(I)-binding protein